MTLHISPRQRLGAAGALLLALGAAGGAGAVALTRPAVAMAPTVATPIARLSATNGIVTVRGRVASAFGDRFLLQDATGRALVDVGRDGDDAPAVGSTVMVQGRFDRGQLRARYLVDAGGTVREVAPPPPPRGPGMGHPRPPHGAATAPPPPPAAQDGGG